MLLVLVIVIPAGAQEQKGSTISRGFRSSSGNIVQGALVSGDKNNSSNVVLADTESASRLAGVVSKTSLLELSNSGESDVQVALSGTAVVLVSDINGQVKAGDKITASPLSGVGMLATQDTQIVGTAQSDFNVPSAKSQKIKDKDGKEHTVRMGYVSVQLGISYYVAPTSQFVPPFLQNLADSIAGRPVSFIRVLLSCLLLLLAFGSIFVLIYTSVRSGIISLGRNPLAANAIQHGLIGVVVIVALVAVLALVGVYLLLRL
jgi:hypothetical protein